MPEKPKIPADPYALILAALESGTLAPGTRLRETDLAEQFNTSRTPIRNALQRLMSQGLVVQAASNGVALAKLQYAQVVELYQMRERLEAAAARLAAINNKPATIRALEDALASMSERKNGGRGVERDDWIFHTIIHNGSGNDQLIRLMGNLRVTSMLIPHLGEDIDLHPHTIDDHANIAAAIGKGDPDAAYRAAKEHIGRDLAVRLPYLVGQDVEVVSPY